MRFLASLWMAASALDCSSHDDLQIRYVAGVPERGPNMYLVTVLQRLGAAVTSDDLTLSEPVKIHLDNSTTDPAVLQGWEAWYHQTAELSMVCDETRTVQLTFNGTTCSYTFFGPPVEGEMEVIFGDPYYGNGHDDDPKWSLFARNVREELPGMLNALFTLPSYQSIGILGDLWYEFTPADALDFNRRLSKEVRQAHLFTTPGNHDIWKKGHFVAKPEEIAKTQHGVGTAQFWLQDSIARQRNPEFDTFHGLGVLRKNYTDHFAKNQPIAGIAPEWGQSYFKRGLKGYIIYNSFWGWEHQVSFFEKACAAMEDPHIRVILLITHWSQDTTEPDSKRAAGADLSGQHAYHRILKEFPQSPCAAAAKKGQMKYIQGHDHFNACIEEATVGKQTVCIGFQLGGMGRDQIGSSSHLQPSGKCPDCEKTLVLPVMETRGDQLSVSFLHIDDQMHDQYQLWRRCIAAMKHAHGDWNRGFVESNTACQPESGRTMIHTWTQTLDRIFDHSDDEDYISV